MSMTFGMKKATLKAFGHRVDIPNNAFTKLMYYLNYLQLWLILKKIF